MPPLTLMQPAPGTMSLPIMRYAGAAASTREDVVVLVFEARDERPGQDAQVTIRVPIPKGDGPALVERLQALLAPAAQA